MAKNQEVAVKEEPKTVMTKLTAEEIKALEGVEGAGLSDNVEDRGTPLIYIAQKQTPQCEERDAKYIKGLKPGMVFNNLTGEFYDAEKVGLPFLPCFMRMGWDEWTPRDNGGGYHGTHARDAAILKLAKPFVKKNGKTRRDILVLPNGNELKWTAKYYGVIPTTWTPIIVPMGSTNLGASTRLQSLIGAQKAQAGDRIITKPGFWTTFLLKTTFEQNADGSWFQYAVEIAGPNEDANLREMCRHFAVACAKNQIREAAPEQDSGAGGSPNDGDVPI